MLALIFSSLPAAAAPDSYCINSSARGFPDPLGSSQNITETCALGCINGLCNTGGESSLPLAVLFSAAVLALVYLGLRIRGPAEPLSWLFIPMAFALLAAGFIVQVNTGAHVLGNNNILVGVAFAFIIVLLLLIAVLYIMLIRGGFKKVLPYSRKLKPAVR